MSGFIPPKTYKIITKLTPVITCDILLESKGKYLLLKRKHFPCKGFWWTPGGRVYKNEQIRDAAHRVVKEELGIKKINIKKFLGVFELFCSPGKFNQKDMFCITFGFLVKPIGSFKIKMDEQHSEYRFFSKPPSGSHPFVKKIFYLAGKKGYSIAMPYSFKIKG
jgi:colanic acid biosynthesis protein WcaH|tara:strand:+ start:752 stop:1243 length:492 start_codon:yes stop_codon:yes gene_type:complete